MGFLADIGRSGALRDVPALVDLTLRRREFKKQQERQKFEFKRIQAEETRLDQPLDISTRPFILNHPEEDRAEVLKQTILRVDANGDGITTVREWERFQIEFLKDEEMVKIQTKNELRMARDNAVAAHKKLVDAQATELPGSEKLKKAEALFSAKAKELQIRKGEIDKILEESRKFQRQRQEASDLGLEQPVTGARAPVTAPTPGLPEFQGLTPPVREAPVTAPTVPPAPAALGFRQILDLPENRAKKQLFLAARTRGDQKEANRIAQELVSGPKRAVSPPNTIEAVVSRMIDNKKLSLKEGQKLLRKIPGGGNINLAQLMLNAVKGDKDSDAAVKKLQAFKESTQRLSTLAALNRQENEKASKENRKPSFDNVIDNFVALTGRREESKIRAIDENKPLNEKSVFWILPDGQSVDPGSTPKQAREQGAIPATQKGIDIIRSARGALIQLRQYRDLAKKLLIRQTGNPLADIVFAEANNLKLSLLNAKDPDVRKFKALAGAITVLARATGADSRVSDNERVFLLQFVPSLADTFEGATAVLDQAETIFRGVAQGAGVPTTALPSKGGDIANRVREFMSPQGGGLSEDEAIDKALDEERR